MLRQYKEQDGNVDSEKQIRQAFKVFDRDNNGYIDKNELRYVKCYLFVNFWVDQCMRSGKRTTET